MLFASDIALPQRTEHRLDYGDFQLFFSLCSNLRHTPRVFTRPPLCWVSVIFGLLRALLAVTLISTCFEFFPIQCHQTFGAHPLQQPSSKTEQAGFVTISRVFSVVREDSPQNAPRTRAPPNPWCYGGVCLWVR